MQVSFHFTTRLNRNISRCGRASRLNSRVGLATKLKTILEIHGFGNSLILKFCNGYIHPLLDSGLTRLGVVAINHYHCRI